MKKTFGILALVFVLSLFVTGCYKKAVVVVEDLSGAIMTGSIAITGNLVEQVATGEVMTGTTTSVLLTGVGTEPFWSFVLSGTELARTAPDDLSGNIVTTMYTGVDQIISSGASTIYANVSGTISLFTTPGSCSDGMSDTVYPASVAVLLSGNSFNGCIK